MPPTPDLMRLLRPLGERRRRGLDLRARRGGVGESEHDRLFGAFAVPLSVIVTCNVLLVWPAARLSLRRERVIVSPLAAVPVPLSE